MLKYKKRSKLYWKEYRSNWKDKNKDKVAEYTKRYNDKHKDAVHERSRLWRLNNKEKLSLYYKAYRKLHPRKIGDKYCKYKSSAKKRGHDFKLSLGQFEELVNIKKCHYCATLGRVGLDRVDSSKGYLLDNVVPCCWPCNKLKRRMTSSKYVALCIAVAKNNS